MEAVRGGPTKAGDLKVLPTYHPRLLQVKPELREVFAIDVAKMLRWHDDALMWQDPVVHYQPTPEFAAKWYLANQGKQLAYDVETDGVDSLTAGLRCIGIGTSSEVLMLGFLSVDGEDPAVQPCGRGAAQDALLRKVLTDTVLAQGRTQRWATSTGPSSSSTWASPPTPLHRHHCSCTSWGRPSTSTAWASSPVDATRRARLEGRPHGSHRADRPWTCMSTARRT